MEEAVYQTPTFWVALSFVVFAFLASRPVARVIARALDQRSARIAEDLAAARRLREEAEATLAVYQKKQKESLQEIDAMLAGARDDATRMADQAQADLKMALDKRMKQASERIAQAETKALRDVQEHVVDIAVAAARTLIQEHLTRGGNEELVKQVAKELERKLH